MWVATESLFIFSGAFYSGFEFIERGASMVAPIALYIIIGLIGTRQLVTARPLTSAEPAIKTNAS